METRFNKNYQLYRKYLEQIIVMYQKRNDLRLFLETFLTIGAVVFFGLFAVKPTLVTVAELYRGKQAKEETLNTLNTKIENLIQAEKLYNQYENEIALLHQAIPSEPQVEEVVRQIEGAANKNEVLLLAFDLDQVVIKGQAITNEQNDQQENATNSEKPGAAKEIVFELSVAGEYNQLLSFLTHLERMRRPIKFLEFDFRKPPTGVEATGPILLNIKGATVYTQENE